MSTCFDIRSSTADYSVSIEAGLFESMLREKSQDVLIADSWFSAQLAAANREAILIPANETSKSLDSIPELIISLRKLGANRHTRLISLGGGVVQDVVAFVASVFMRGINWIYFPTTLLAMADSCIGGKSSINVGPYKNIVGTFHPPQAVLIDPSLALTLNDERRIGGLVEAVKICYCRGEESFEEYMALDPQKAMDIEKVEQIVKCSLRAKKWFIEVDEFDRAERLLLNFGHTFGHAIEGASHFRIEHGIGVGIGILCALELGRLIGRNYATATRPSMLEDYLRPLLLAVPGLGPKISELPIAEVLDRFQADKKHGIDFYSVILIAECGKVELFRFLKDKSSTSLIETAILNTMDSFVSPNSKSMKTNEI